VLLIFVRDLLDLRALWVKLDLKDLRDLKDLKDWLGLQPILDHEDFKDL
jgi:hypothetical protein